MDKKGLSPLASTMLLLIISILIGIAVMSWGRTYIEDFAVKQEAKITQPAPQPSIFADIDARLADGEITKAQYDQIKAVLMAQQAAQK